MIIYFDDDDDTDDHDNNDSYNNNNYNNNNYNNYNDKKIYKMDNLVTHHHILIIRIGRYYDD